MNTENFKLDKYYVLDTDSLEVEDICELDPYILEEYQMEIYVEWNPEEITTYGGGFIETRKYKSPEDVEIDLDKALEIYSYELEGIESELQDELIEEIQEAIDELEYEEMLLDDLLWDFGIHEFPEFLKKELTLPDWMEE